LTIEYNHLSLPEKITKTATGETITIVYDATGTKLRKTTTNLTTTTLPSIATPSGVLTPNITYIKTPFGGMTPFVEPQNYTGITITSASTIPIGATVTMTATQSIELQLGFTAEQGSNSTISICPTCPTTTTALVATTQDYVGGIEYKNTALEAIYHSEGRIYKGQYEYTLKDHLGNSRVTFRDKNGVAELLQENHYYPFGMNQEGKWASTPNKYQYNGKELNEDLGLNWNDYGARWYDAAIGRWSVADPMSEKAANQTPYRYGFNNPMNFIDPNGMFEYSDGYGTHDSRSESGSVSHSGSYQNGDGPKPKVILVFYHGGPGGQGQIKGKSNEDTGFTGSQYDAVYNYALSQCREVIGAVIAPALTQSAGVETGINFIENNYNEGDQVIIYGYSYGGDNAVNLAEAAQEKNIPINTLYTIDSSDGPGRGITVDTSVPTNVNVAYNIYQTNYSGASSGSQSIKRGSSDSDSMNSPGSRGYHHTAEGNNQVYNYDVSKKGVNHGNIQEKYKIAILNHLFNRINEYGNK
jgi:RHS repeat-associated protein